MYPDDVLHVFINNPDFGNYLCYMCPVLGFDIKNTTESNTSASFLDLLLSIESGGQLQTYLKAIQQVWIYKALYD